MRTLFALAALTAPLALAGCRSMVNTPTQMTVAPLSGKAEQAPTVGTLPGEPRVEVATVIRGQSDDGEESMVAPTKVPSKLPSFVDPSVTLASFADGESLFAPPPWGYGYVAPGEATCSPPDPSESCGFSAPPGAYAPMMVQPPPMVAVPVPGASASDTWNDALPSEGGAISPDFGLPREPVVDNRLPNPVFVPTTSPDAAWESMAEAVASIFPIQSERRAVATQGNFVEGAFETPWQTGATIFEPWRRDSAGAFNRWQSTLQTIRRRANVRVVPVSGGYEVGVRVDKQLEDLVRPERATAGAASLRNDSSLPTDRLNPPSTVLGSERWIDIGRDEPLEQRLLGRIRDAVAQQGR